MAEAPKRAAVAGLSFFTNHAYVLIMIGSDHTMRMRDLAREIGITERAVQRIVEELVTGGYLVVSKSGRRNSYSLNTNSRLQHPLSENLCLEDLLRLGSNQRYPNTDH